jgi:hypothetical protein
MLAKYPDQRPSLDVVEAVLRDAIDVIDAPMRFAEGSSPAIVLPRSEPWYLRWLMVKRIEPMMSADPLSRAVLPFAPPFKLGWAAFAAGIAAAAAIASLIAG